MVPRRQGLQGDEEDDLYRYSEDREDAKGANHVRGRGCSPDSVSASLTAGERRSAPS